MSEIAQTTSSRRTAWRLKTSPRVNRIVLAALSVLSGVVAWDILAHYSSPLFMPSPAATLLAAKELFDDGTLLQAVLASSLRIAAGWALGVIVGVPLGVLMGRFAPLRQFLDPYIEFFRFIPPIAFVTLAVIWLGPGEAAKIALIFYTTVFIVTLNTIAGVQAVNPLRLRAAASLGAGQLQMLTTVILPSTVPFMVTGARIAMGNSFLTVVSAEIVSADNGLGALIWTARNFARTEWVFVGIIALGLLGYLFDRALRIAVDRLLRRYRLTT